MKNGTISCLSILAIVSMVMLSGAAMAANNTTGDRIWDATANQSLEYTWTALSYSGFYFDLDSGEGSETLRIKLDSDTDRSIGTGDLMYSTAPIETKFAKQGWGSYEVIGFMAERYFAAYTDDTAFADDTVSLMSNGILAKILQDDDRRVSLFAGSSLILQEGYRLNIVEVDLQGNNVLITLEKDGTQVDTAIVSGNEDYVYKQDLGNVESVPIIAVHFDSIFRGTETNAVFVGGVFQVSENYTEVQTGDTFARMEVMTVRADEITMENRNIINLRRGSTINIMGKLNFRIADDNILRFGPVVDMSEPGIYELRGTVAEGEKLKWTPLNFEGFYYNIDEGVGTESLEITDLSNRRIDSLVYRSVPQGVSFERSQWGEFQVIGFLAEKYFAGYHASEFTSDLSLLSNGQLSKVLIDDNSRKSLFTGSSLILDEGYQLRIVEVDLGGNNVMVNLLKDGNVVETDILSANDDFVYRTDVGTTDDLPIIVVHFATIFRGTEANAVFVDGIFQISEDVVEVQEGERFGRMEVRTFTENEIVLENRDTLTLTRARTIPVMGDISFKVADSTDVRYYPFVEVSTLPARSLSIDVPPVLKQGESVNMVVTSRGAAVEGATVRFGNVDVGQTSNEGVLPYTPANPGVFTVTAIKEGFVSASKTVEVALPEDASRKIIIEVSPYPVVEGQTITIYVLTAIGEDPVEGAQLYYDNNLIGSTDSDGVLTYTVQEAGVHKLEAMADEYFDAELDFEVLPLESVFTYSNLQVTPLLVNTGETVTITVDVQNTGTSAGEIDVDLFINDEVADSRSVSLDAGEQRTVTFTISEEEAGRYDVQIGETTAFFEVEERVIPAPGMLVTLLAAMAVFLFIRIRDRPK